MADERSAVAAALGYAAIAHRWSRRAHALIFASSLPVDLRLLASSFASSLVVGSRLLTSSVSLDPAKRRESEEEKETEKRRFGWMRTEDDGRRCRGVGPTM